MTPCWPGQLAAWCCATAEEKLPAQRVGSFAEAMSDDLDQVKKLADNEREAAEMQAKMLRDRVFQLADDPTKTSGLPTALDRVPHVEFAALDDAVDRLKREAKEYDDALAKNGATLSGAQLARRAGVDARYRPAVGAQRRPARPALVQESDLRARPLYRL